MDIDTTLRILSWDGHEGRLIVNGYRFIMATKPDLSFDFDELIYAPDGGNTVIELPNGLKRDLTDLEKAEIEDYITYFMDEADYIVQAYSEPYNLFEGEMQKSTAEAEGFKYRVNEIPDHPASKWMGDHWERIAMIVMDDGDVNRYPDAICGSCVFGFAESEMDQVPDRPSTYHTWDMVNGGWIDARPLKAAKREAESSIRAVFEFYRYESSEEGYWIPDYESKTWDWQVFEARDWLADNNAETPYIDAFLAARTDEDKPTKQALCEDILENHRKFLARVATINGVQWGYLHRVKHAQTNEECIAIQEEAQAYCEHKQAELNG